MALLLVATACGGAPAARSGPAAPAVTELPRPVVPPVEPDVAPAGLGPEILLPAAGAEDGEVARVGDVVLRKSHVYSRLQTVQPKITLDALDLLIVDVLVARHAQQFGIQVSAERVDQLAALEEERIKKQLQAEFGSDMTLPAYVWRVFGMREGDWRQLQRLNTAQQLYRGYVIRYLALREDRVHVRFLVHRDEKVAREVVDKVRAGADFATLALRHSEDPSRRDGGLMAPFGRGSAHPFVAKAFELQRGDVSEPFRARTGDEERWFVVYCLDRMPARDVTFAAVAAELDKDLAQRPITPSEQANYQLRWRGELEANAKQAPGNQ